MKNNRILNDYVVIYKPEHPKAMRGGNWDGYIYEHIVIGEQVIDRPIKEGEEVHHLDFNRSNNSPDNLLVLSGPMHMKLHSWLEKNTVTPTQDYQKRIDAGCVRCKMCKTPIHFDLKYCSAECYKSDTEQRHSFEHPDKDNLEQLVWSKPTTEIAKMFNVSDKAIDKLCKQLEVDKPPRGYWTKVKAGLVCPLTKD